MRWPSAFVRVRGFCCVSVWAGSCHSWVLHFHCSLLLSLQLQVKAFKAHVWFISFAVYILWRFDSFEEGFRSFSPESKNKLCIKSGINFCLLTLRHQMDGLTAPTCWGCALELDTHVAAQMTALESVSVMETDVVSLWWSGVEQCSSI